MAETSARSARSQRSKRSESELAPGDAIFLSFLTWGPMSAYDIKKVMAVSVSFFWSAAHSQVYQQAARLARDGYVKEKEAPGGRRKKILSLTPKGRAAVKRWIESPAQPLALYDEALAKLFFGAEADQDKLRDMAERYREGHIHLLVEFEGIRTVLESTDHPAARYQLMALRLGIRVARQYVEWLDEILDELP